jgi:hypothetical protein
MGDQYIVNPKLLEQCSLIMPAILISNSMVSLPINAYAKNVQFA